MTDIQLDSIDRKIIGVLQNDGRTSNADLAENINLSASACHRRVQRLHSTGIIKNYVALLNVEITLSGQADEVLDAFERQVQLIPDVLECHLMSGSADYLLKVVAKDTDDFARIHRKYLARLPGVAQMHSSFSLRSVSNTTALPI